MKRIALYNPHAGKTTTDEKIATIRGTYPTECELVDMTKLTSYADFFAALDPDDVVTVCGGDGTLNRFINDTQALSLQHTVTYFPMGTGNDFLKDIEADPNAGEIVLNNYLKQLPIATVNGKEYRFLNNVGFGIDGYCCEVGDAQKAAGKKKVDYTAIAIQGLLFHFKPANATVTVDGVAHTYKKVWLAPTMHGRFYGGGMMPAPDQDRMNESGELSVMIWHSSGKLSTLLAFPSLFKGEHLKHKKMIEVLKGHTITVEFDKPCALQIDGETHLGITRYEARSARVPAKEPLAKA